MPKPSYMLFSATTTAMPRKLFAGSSQDGSSQDIESERIPKLAQRKDNLIVELMKLRQAVYEKSRHDWTQYNYFFPNLEQDREDAYERFSKSITDVLDKIKIMHGSGEVTITDFVEPHTVKTKSGFKQIQPFEVLLYLEFNHHVLPFLETYLLPQILLDDEANKVANAVTCKRELLYLVALPSSGAKVDCDKIKAKIIELEKMGGNPMELNDNGVNLLVAIFHSIRYKLSGGDAELLAKAVDLLCFLSDKSYLKADDLDKKYSYIMFDREEVCNPLLDLKRLAANNPQFSAALLDSGLFKAEVNNPQHKIGL